ncbi:MAG: hypothetical protein M3454_11810 [Actinomycetota bacterium]|nr:hypothetical protein [Actinomycetota bacterium]
MTDLAPKTGTRPPRNYSWPPFEEGNLAGLRHGAYSERLVGADTEVILEQALASVPWLAEPQYAASVRSWARSEAVVSRLADWLATVGVLDGDGNPRPALAALAQFERQAAERRSALGLDPSSRARIERDLSSSAQSRVSTLTDALAEGRKLREAAQARMANGEAAS